MELEELLKRIRDQIVVIGEDIEYITSTKVLINFLFSYPEKAVAGVTMHLNFIADTEDIQYNGAKWRYLKRRYNWK